MLFFRLGQIPVVGMGRDAQSRFTWSPRVAREDLLLESCNR